MKQPNFLSTTAVVLPLSIITLALTGCGSSNNQGNTAKASAPQVLTHQVASTTIAPQVDFVGRTVADQDVEFRPRVSGHLTKINVDDGELVEAGQLLYQIDPRPYQAKVDAAEALLQQNIAKHKLAMLNQQRAEDLYAQNSLSKMQVDMATTEAQAAQAQVDLAQASLEEAELQLSYTQIKAPFDGRVDFVRFDEGDLVRANLDVLSTLVSIDPVLFNFSADEKQFRKIRSGLEKATSSDTAVSTQISLKLSDGSVYSEAGKIDAIANRVDQSSGSVSMLASFDNSHYSLLPGEYATLQVTFSSDAAEGILIPQAALQQNQAGFYVMVVDENNQVNNRFVELGKIYQGQQHVISGLDQGEHIVVEGLQKIRPGITVAPTLTKGA